MDLSGVLIPSVTPFDPVTGELDRVALRANVRSWRTHPVRGFVVGGSTGEAVLLDEDERTAALVAARDQIPPDRLLIAGTGAESTRATIRRTREAAEAGADAVLVQPPSFYRDAMRPGVLRDHYRAVADAAPVPVILYQVPLRFSTVELATGLVAELSEHPNVVGVKDSRGDLALVGALVEATRAGFQILVGNGAKLYGSLEVGAVGGILGVANLVPGETAAIVQAVADGRGAEAGRLQERVGPLHTGIVASFGVPGVKVALDLMGLRGGPPRPPLSPLEQRDRTIIRDLLEPAGILERPSAAEPPVA